MVHSLLAVVNGGLRYSHAAVEPHNPDRGGIRVPQPFLLAQFSVTNTHSLVSYSTDRNQAVPCPGGGFHLECLLHDCLLHDTLISAKFRPLTPELHCTTWKTISYLKSPYAAFVTGELTTAGAIIGKDVKSICLSV